MVKWQGRQQSSNIEDRRGQGSGGGGLGGGFGRGGGLGGSPGGGVRFPVGGRSGGMSRPVRPRSDARSGFRGPCLFSPRP